MQNVAQGCKTVKRKVTVTFRWDGEDLVLDNAKNELAQTLPQTTTSNPVPVRERLVHVYASFVKNNVMDDT